MFTVLDGETGTGEIEDKRISTGGRKVFKTSHYKGGGGPHEMHARDSCIAKPAPRRSPEVLWDRVEARVDDEGCSERLGGMRKVMAHAAPAECRVAELGSSGLRTAADMAVHLISIEERVFVGKPVMIE